MAVRSGFSYAFVSPPEGGLRKVLCKCTATVVEGPVVAEGSQWQPVALVLRNGVWHMERPIAAGPHRIAVRLDGGEWRAPANLPSLKDELGAKVGLITIP